MFSSGASANLLDNGSFGSGTFNPASRANQKLPVGSTAIDGWTTIGDLVALVCTGNPWSLSANDGDRFLDLTDFASSVPVWRRDADDADDRRHGLHPVV